VNISGNRKRNIQSSVLDAKDMIGIKMKKTKTLYDDTDLDWLGRGHIKEIYEDEETGEVVGRDIQLGLFNVKTKVRRIPKEKYDKLMDDEVKLLE
tara:strand:+ start:1969 stop:2253 length:285 start_codon:yes stop_codon:yes gene_type:complete